MKSRMWCGAVAFLVSACATVNNGPLQRIHVDSVPVGAAVTKTHCGTKRQTVTAPAVLWVSRRSTDCTLTFSMENYDSETVVLRRGVSPVTDRNLFALEQAHNLSSFFFGLLLGATTYAVDAASGGMFELHPSVVTVELRPAEPDDSPPTFVEGSSSTALRSRDIAAEPIRRR